MEIEKKENLIYLFNKCTMLYIHLDKNSKKDVLENMKDFIQKIEYSFEKNDILKNLKNNERKEKLITLFIPYLKNLIDSFMLSHLSIDDNKKDFIIKEIDISSHNNAKKLLQNNENIKEIHKEVVKKEVVIVNEKEALMKNVYDENMNKVTSKITTHIDNKVIELYEELQKFFEKKFEIMSEEIDEEKKNVFEKMDDYVDKHEKYMNYVSEQIAEEIEKKIIEKNENYVKENYGKVRDEIMDKVEYNLENVMKSEIHEKIEKLTHILNKNLETSLKNSSQLNNEQIQTFLDKKIQEYEYVIENSPYTLFYDKLTNKISLKHKEKVISSVELPILQGLQGIQGIQGAQGIKGSTPKLHDLNITKEGYLSIMVNDENGTYELRSKNTIPQNNNVMNHNVKEVQKEIQKEVIYKTNYELNFDKTHVMRLDTNHDNNLIILKSLSVGEQSNCIKPNSLAIGGATCFQENSFGIGNKTQTLSKNSVALFGSTSGENSFAYRSNNVPSNQFIIGESNGETSNIQKIVLNAEHIQLQSKNIQISAYDQKIKALEQKIQILEKMVKKEDETTNKLTSIFSTSFVQDKFF